MRFLSVFAAATLLATTAWAQGITTDPVGTSTSPFNSQNPNGDGVPVNAVAGAAASTAGAASGVGLGRIFNEADTNHDNVVTREEFLAKAERHFGMADTNKDNKITREEMQAQQNSIMQQMQNSFLGAGGWQGKLNQFMGGTATTTGAGGPAAPVAPVVTSPMAPTVPRAY